MSSTAHINMINITASAVDQVARDQKNGTYAANLAADPDYYMWWNNDFEIIPEGMDGNPEAFVAGIVKGLPGVNTLHVPFNENNFRADGSMHPQFERFLTAAAAQGLKIVMVYCSGVAQRLDDTQAASAAEIHKVLSQEVGASLGRAWDGMLDWLDDHRAVKAATWGLEVMNEPHGYRAGEQAGGDADGFYRLYAKHVLDTARQIEARFDGKVLVDGYGWSQDFNGLAETALRPGSDQSIMDAIRDAVGNDLVWSAHLYPHWLDRLPGSAEDFRETLDSFHGVLGKDDILITETNAQDLAVNDHRLGNNHERAMTRVYEVLEERGIGIGWFPAIGGGESALIGIWGDGTLTYGQLNSLAHAMNGFSLGDAPRGHAGAETLTARIVQGRVFDDAEARLPIPGVGFAFGYGGNDVLKADGRVVNLLYGGTGNDLLTGGGHDDHLFGQGGNDDLRGGNGDDHLFGGFGRDRLDGGAGADLLWGGEGADVFVLDKGNDIVEDYSSAEGDRLLVNGSLHTLRDLRGNAARFDGDGDGIADELRIRVGGATVLFTDLPGDDLLYGHGRDPAVQGSHASEVMAVGYRERHDGDQITEGGDVIHALGGDDRVAAGRGGDAVTGGAGNDTLWGEDGHDRLHGDAGNDALWGDAGADLLAGGSGTDTLDGGAGNDRLEGGDGGDRLRGLDGNDVLRGDAGDDTLEGGSGNDRLWGGSGNDRMWGHEGNDRLDADGGTDVLDGGAGNDRVRLHLGGDSWHVASGGVGRDSFVLAGVGGDAGGARIADFDPGQDRVIVEGHASLAKAYEAGAIRSYATTWDGVMLNLAGGDRAHVSGLSLGGLERLLGGREAEGFSFRAGPAAAADGLGEPATDPAMARMSDGRETTHEVMPDLGSEGGDLLLGATLPDFEAWL